MPLVELRWALMPRSRLATSEVKSVANPDYSGLSSDRKGRAKSPPDPGTGKGGKGSFPVKPGFNTGSFGKKQPSDRSGGVTRAKVYPNSEGL